jgi:hypothetical protein
MANPKATTARKTNVATETVIGASAQALSKAVSEFKSAISHVDGLEDRAAELSLQVANKTAEVEGLDTIYSEKLRQKEVEFGLQFKENSEKVVNDHLATSGKIAISKADFQALQSDLEAARANTKKEVDAATAIVGNTLKSQYEAAAKLAEANHKTDTIESKSQIASLTEKNEFLEKQNNQLIEQLNAERQASIERAKAGAIGTISVNGAAK